MAGEKGGKLLCAVGNNGDALGFQVLEGPTDVEDGLDAGADDSDRSAAELIQISRDVHGVLHSAVHTSNASSDKHLDAGHVRDVHSGSDGGGSVGFLGDDRGEVAAGALSALVTELSQCLQILSLEPDVQLALEDGDGGWDSSVVASDLLYSKGSL